MLLIQKCVLCMTGLLESGLWIGQGGISSQGWSPIHLIQSDPSHYAASCLYNQHKALAQTCGNQQATTLSNRTQWRKLDVLHCKVYAPICKSILLRMLQNITFHFTIYLWQFMNMSASLENTYIYITLTVNRCTQ